MRLAAILAISLRVKRFGLVAKHRIRAVHPATEDQSDRLSGAPLAAVSDMAPALDAIHVHDHHLDVLVFTAHRLLRRHMPVVDFIHHEPCNPWHFVQLGCGRVLI
ncbi:MAG: hypothetical protein ACK55I_26680 [bacterium]